MNYQLVIQFPITDAGADDFDRLLMIENELGLVLSDKHQVGGHDIGSGVMNIFIHTNDPNEAFELVKKTLSKNNLDTILAAYTEMNGDKYSVIWPDDYNDEFTII